MDPKISREEKSKYMVEWYEKAEKLLYGFEFRIEELQDIIKREKMELR